MSYTDSKGTVSFNQMNKLGKRFEDHEYVYINIKPDRNAYLAVLLEGMSNLDKAYYGYYISNYNHCFENPSNWDAKPIDGIDVMINGGSLNRNNEYIIIKLRKYNNNDKKGKRIEINCNHGPII